MQALNAKEMNELNSDFNYFNDATPVSKNIYPSTFGGA